jgi:hypothetical protein
MNSTGIGGRTVFWPTSGTKIRENGLGQFNPFSVMAMFMAALTVEITRLVDIVVILLDIR